MEEQTQDLFELPDFEIDMNMNLDSESFNISAICEI